jgi:hypothetical protein
VIIYGDLATKLITMVGFLMPYHYLLLLIKPLAFIFQLGQIKLHPFFRFGLGQILSALRLIMIQPSETHFQLKRRYAGILLGLLSKRL